LFAAILFVLLLVAGAGGDAIVGVSGMSGVAGSPVLDVIDMERTGLVDFLFPPLVGVAPGGPGAAAGGGPADGALPPPPPFGGTGTSISSLGIVAILVKNNFSKV